MVGTRWVRGSLVWVGLAATACATAGGSPTGTVAEQMLRLAGNHDTPRRDDSEVFWVDTLAAPPARTFVAVAEVYRALGLPLNFADQAALQLGGTVLRLGTVDGKLRSAWLDCGRGPTAQPNADLYDVTLTIASRVVAVEPGSTVETVLRAHADPRDVTADRLPCNSLRTIEPRIAELVRERTGG